MLDHSHPDAFESLKETQLYMLYYDDKFEELKKELSSLPTSPGVRALAARVARDDPRWVIERSTREIKDAIQR